ncbi:MAG TPA: hypothetical protein VFQ14_01835 [Thermoleophilaceae bacterium]|nr:hypothetical protein [Thermoleophilaceae bacterium]
MKRYLIPALAAAVLAFPAGAQAKVIELGAGGSPPAASNCPNDPCVAAYQVTAYQGRSGSLKNPFVVPRPGKIVAFTVSLGKLTDTQIEFFNGRFGDDPQVQLSILRRSTKKGKKGNHRLMRQSEVYDVSRFLGSTPTFALDEPIVVGKDARVALTVPTWAPVLDTVDLARSDWWRASRAKDDCGKDDKLSPPSVQDEVGEVVDYQCTYFNSRLLYTATYIPDPKPTDGSDKKAKKSVKTATATGSALLGPARPAFGGVLAP